MSEETMYYKDDPDVIREQHLEEVADKLKDGEPIRVNGNIVMTVDDLLVAVIEHTGDDNDPSVALIEAIKAQPKSRLARIVSVEANRLADDVLEMEADYECAKEEDRAAAMADLRYDQLREEGEL